MATQKNHASVMYGKEKSQITQTMTAVIILIFLMMMNASVVRAVDFSAGHITGTLTWQGQPLQGTGVSTVFILIPGVTGAYLNGGSGYDFNAIAPGTYPIQVYGNGCNQVSYLLGQTTATAVSGSTTVADIDLTPTAGRVIGKVTLNGQTFSNPKITIAGFCGQWQTASDGSFAHFLAPGTYTASVAGQAGTLGTFSFTINAGQVTDVGTIDFQTGAIRGLITWNGSTVNGLGTSTVFISLPGIAGNYILGDGSYSFTGLVPGTYTTNVYGNGCALDIYKIGSAQITATAGSTTTTNIDLSATAGRVTGTITVNGSPLPSPSINIAGLCGNWQTGGSGQFLHYLPPGSYTANVNNIGTFSFTITAGQTTALGNIDFLVGNITGTLSWNGSPVTGSGTGTIFIALIGTTGQYNNTSTGSYSFPALVPKSYDLGVFGNGCITSAYRLGGGTINVVGGTNTTANVDLTSTAGRVVGRITVNGVPLPNPSITIPGFCGQWQTASDGTFLHYLPPGTYTANVAGNSGTIGSFTFAILAGQTTDVDFGSTPSGTNVDVQLDGGLQTLGGVGLTFSNVSATGSTTVVESGSGPPPPTGYKIQGLNGQTRYWDIDTTAQFSGPITVCIKYDDSQLTAKQESRLSLWHYTSGAWQNVTNTGSPDVNNNIICGTVTSLSPFTVMVEDTPPDETPPVLNLPADITSEATSAGGAVVTFTVTATDDDGSNPVVTCTPDSGSVFPLGNTTVNCSSKDAAGNEAAQSFVVHVIDRTAPILTVSDPAPVEAQGPGGAVVTYVITVMDTVDPSPNWTCTPASGSMFALGTTPVACSASDQSGNHTGASFAVVVRDTTAPTLTAPADLFTLATSANGAIVTYQVASAADTVDGLIVPTCVPQSGSGFPLGSSTVSCSATDHAGNSVQASFHVIVQVSWSNVLQPLNSDGSSVFKQGSTVPVKFVLTNSSSPIQDLTPRLYVAKISDGVLGTELEATSTATADAGNVFRFDPSTGVYIFNWGTKSLTAGTYQLRIDLGDGALHIVTVSLKK